MIKVKTVSIEGEPLESTLATLRDGVSDQVALSLVFGFDVPTTFTIEGNKDNEVYLSGYYQPGPDQGDDSVRWNIPHI